MIKTHKDSYFVLYSLNTIRTNQLVILQVEKTEAKDKDTGYDLYLCEVVHPLNFKDTVTMESLSAEIIRLNKENQRLQRKVDQFHNKIIKMSGDIEAKEDLESHYAAIKMLEEENDELTDRLRHQTCINARKGKNENSR